jgi:hypothetical protein
VIQGETNIVDSRSPIRRCGCPAPAAGPPQTLDASNMNIITIGPGSLYTSIILISCRWNRRRHRDSDAQSCTSAASCAAWETDNFDVKIPSSVV